MYQQTASIKAYCLFFFIRTTYFVLSQFVQPEAVEPQLESYPLSFAGQPAA